MLAVSFSSLPAQTVTGLRKTESAGPKIAEFSGVRAYTVRGVFERRGIKAGPQATAQAARSGLYAS